jgi:serine/threonine protein phosphatase PrpC
MSEQSPTPEQEPEHYEKIDTIWTEGFDKVRRIEGKSGLIVLGTDIGIQRKKNEDALVINTGKDRFAVIDGMGGEGNGDIAAGVFAEELKSGFAADTPTDEIQIKAHRRMQEASLGNGGACYAAIEVTENRCTIAHAGDVDVVIAASRGYIKFQSESEGAGSSVYNAVTGDSPGETTIETVSVNNGDRIYLASDGLWHNINIEEIIQRTIHLPVEKAIQMLVEEAKKRMVSDEVESYPDNITILIYDLRTLGG